MMDHRYNDPLVLPEIYRGLIKNIDLTSTPSMNAHPSQIQGLSLSHNSKQKAAKSAALALK